MTLRERCDRVTELIDQVLDDYAAALAESQQPRDIEAGSRSR